ncbi:DUF4142 domain-containing protein [Mucilaginibacter gynuensis]|uniref:DUF4142 domain-containing protein n=1 Tax=Mucilaginibacter gynuensis TaxID=1302236 RepID=A0ABP8FR28_9SPHI
MRKINCVAVAIAALMLLQACDERRGKNYNDQTTLGSRESVFIKDGLESGMTEVEAANVAKEQSQNSRVIKFAQMMIDDHTKAGDELKKIQSDLQAPAVDSINTDHQQTIADLSKLSGAEFDHAYLEMMANEHEKIIHTFQEGSQLKNTALSKFAKSNLPVIKMHLDSAKAIVASLK